MALFTERRKNYRLPFDSKVIYTDGEKSATAYSVNISRGGLFMMTMNSYPIDTKINLSFLIPNQTGSFSCKARVAHLVHNNQRSDIECGIGFEFLELTKAQQSTLNLYVVNSKMAYLELKKLLEPERPNLLEVKRRLVHLPKMNTDLLYLRYRIHRICYLFEEDEVTTERRPAIAS